MAVNTRYGKKRAYLINIRGGFDHLDFEFGSQTEIFYSCSVQWKNQYYVFGGWHEKRQVSVLNGNRLERKATLGFNYDNGACAVISEKTVVLCSGYVFWLCRKSENPLGSFTYLPKGNYNHFWTSIASIDGKNTSIIT